MKRLLILLFLSLIAAKRLTAQTDTTSAGKDASNSPMNLSSLTVENVIYTLIILLITYFAVKIVVRIFNIWAERNAKYRIVIKGFIPIVRLIVWFIVMVFVITVIFHPPMATILAFSASVGVAVGFASQDLLKNIFGGITVLFDKPFQVGDKVQIGSFYGEVVEIGLRSTRIVTPDDNLVTVPNGELLNQPVSNANASEQNCQVVTEYYLPRDTDTIKARSLAIEAAKASQHIYLNKPIVVVFAHTTVGPAVMLKMSIKAYVNDIRNEFVFKSELTEVMVRELG